MYKADVGKVGRASLCGIALARHCMGLFGRTATSSRETSVSARLRGRICTNVAPVPKTRLRSIGLCNAMIEGTPENALSHTLVAALKKLCCRTAESTVSTEYATLGRSLHALPDVSRLHQLGKLAVDKVKLFANSSAPHESLLNRTDAAGYRTRVVRLHCSHE